MKTVKIEKELLLKKLDEIDHIIRIQYTKEGHIGVLAGASGVSMFQFYYSKYLNVDENAVLGADILDFCIDKINNGFNHLTYCSGLAGMGWTLDHLTLEGFIDDDTDGFLAQIDEPIFNMMMADLKQGNYDFLHGAIGNALYFLNRYRNTNSEKLKIVYKNNLLKFLIELEKLSEKAGNQKIRWLSRPGVSNEERRYDMGLSHGIASITSFLVKLYQYDDFRPNTDKLLMESIEYLLGHQNEKTGSDSWYPTSVSKNGESSGPSRLSWCYGDLGIGLTLFNASKSLNNNILKTNSLKILKHCTNRIHPENNGVQDAGICHGSFGISQIFNRVYRETGDDIFKNASKFWIQDGLNRATHKDGYAGYKQWSHQDGVWYPTISLLEGVSGIGLTLIDHLADFDTRWDECLMIS